MKFKILIDFKKKIFIKFSGDGPPKTAAARTTNVEDLPHLTPFMNQARQKYAFFTVNFLSSVPKLTLFLKITVCKMKKKPSISLYIPINFTSDSATTNRNSHKDLSIHKNL